MKFGRFPTGFDEGEKYSIVRESNFGFRVIFVTREAG